MAKRIHSIWRLLLGSVITMLGFAACKSTKKLQKSDEMIALYGPPPAAVKERQPIDRVRVLYGVPPIKVERMPEK